MTRDTTVHIAEALQAGQRQALARAITLVESTQLDDRARAAEVLESIMGATGNSIRLGISGAPGVGKSTFIDALGTHLIAADHRVGVLAIDPSSAASGGSILGDKTRMENLARSRKAFIRPSPAGRTLGGVARRTREAILLCEAAGFDVIIVETVGVGQAETMVSEMTDSFLLLLQPGAGDELQGIKRGIMELADVIAVNKADGELEAAARRTAAEFARALDLLRPRSEGWQVPVQACSALTGEGVAEVWGHVERHLLTLSSGGGLSERRAEQARTWLWNETARELQDALTNDPQIQQEVPVLEAEVMAGVIPPTVAARRLVDIFLDQRRRP